MSRPCKPVLHELPPELAKKIVEELDSSSRIRVRKTCRNFRNAVDDRKLEDATLLMGCSEESILVDGPERDFFEYFKDPKGCRIKYNENNVEKEKLIEGEDYVKCAMIDLRVTLSIPKLSMHMLLANDVPPWDPKEFLRTLKAILRDRDSKLSVKHLGLEMIADEVDIVDILSLVKPGTLETISLGAIAESALENLTELPQWKQAKTLSMRTYDGPIDSLLHFHNIHFDNRKHLSLEDAKKLVEAAIQQGEPFERFNIYGCDIDYHIGGYLEQNFVLNAPNQSPFGAQPTPQFGPPPVDLSYMPWANSCFQDRFIEILSEQFCLVVKWYKGSFGVEKIRKDFWC